MIKEAMKRLVREYRIVDEEAYYTQILSELNRRKIKVPQEDVDVIVDLLIENCSFAPLTKDWIIAIKTYYDKRLGFMNSREDIDFCEWSHNKRKKEGHDNVYSIQQFRRELGEFMDEVESSLSKKSLLGKDYIVFCFLRGDDVETLAKKMEEHTTK